MYDDEDDEYENNEKKNDFYIVRVFKQYGIFYLLLLIAFTLCYIIVLLPFTAVILFKVLVSIINWISGDNYVISICLWIFLICSLFSICAYWVVDKIYDNIDKKQIQKKKTNN